MNLPNTINQLAKSNEKFKIVSDFTPSGDQPAAIKTLVKNLNDNENEQVLLGVTGSGKTFTMAKVIEQMQRPTLIMAPNKTLAAQLYGEMKTLFPNNAVEYFVSYYDYYTPEAYVPRSDTFIEKESSINEQIDRLRHSATRSLVERRDTIIVASVSCIYGIGSVEAYSSMSFTIEKNQSINRDSLIRRLVELLYKRRDMDFKRGSFRAKGDILEIFPSSPILTTANRPLLIGLSNSVVALVSAKWQPRFWTQWISSESAVSPSKVKVSPCRLKRRMEIPISLTLLIPQAM